MDSISMVAARLNRIIRIPVPFSVKAISPTNVGVLFGTRHVIPRIPSIGMTDMFRARHGAGTNPLTPAWATR